MTGHQSEERPTLCSARLKLARGRGHREALEGEIRPWIESQHAVLDVTHDPQTGWYRMRFVGMAEPPPEWSLTIGEFAQNVRASLDHLAWQLVLLNDQTPDYWTQFPIYSELPKKPSFLQKVKGMSAGHITEIEQLQPYRAPDPGAKALNLLASLSNVDKHRTLIPHAVVGGDLTNASFNMVPRQEFRPIEVAPPVYAGTPIDRAEFAFRIDPPGARVDIGLSQDLTLELGVVFGQPPGVPLTSLDEITEEVQRILDLFAPSFS